MTSDFSENESARHCAEQKKQLIRLFRRERDKARCLQQRTFEAAETAEHTEQEAFEATEHIV